MKAWLELWVGTSGGVVMERDSQAAFLQWGPPRASVPPELGRSILSEQSPWAPIQTQVREAGPQATPYPSWKPSALEDVLPAKLAVPTLLKTHNL